VLVTGASRGIGAATARALAADGWPVGVGFRADARGAGETAESIARSGGVAVPVCGDVSRKEDVEHVFEELEQRFGAVLVLVNNAGTRSDQLFTAMTDEDWEHTLATNLTGAYRTMRRAVMPMVRARFGRIVNVSSIIAHRPLPGLSNYSASKAALEALTRTVAIEVARRGVTVNAIAPGVVDTELTSDLAQLKQEATGTIIPSRRAGTPEDVAGLVRFLASDEAAYMTGATLVIDGGLESSLFPLPRPAAATTAGARGANSAEQVPALQRR
jgi:3-oxoacyl-[acyl-carrier protein] reductase